MADNIVLNAGSGGATLAAASLSVSGDTAIVQMIASGILSGSEGSWTYTQIVGGAGAVTAGVPRVTLASDDPGVALLTTIDADTSAMVVDLAAIEALLTTMDADTSTLAAVDFATGADVASLAVVGGGAEATALRVTLASDSTGVLSVDDGGGALTVDGTVTAELSATDNAVLDDIAANQTDGSQKTQIVDGAGNVIASTSNALHVAIISGAGTGGTASDDDADFTAGTTAGTPAMGVYESSPTSITDGDMGIVGLTQTRAMRVSVDNAVTVDLGANNDVTLATLPDTAAGDLAAMVVDLAAIEALLTTIDADTSTLAAVDFATGADVASLAVVGGGVEATALRVTLASDSTGVLSVDDGGGALTVDGTVTAELSATDNAVLDDIAAKLGTIDADTSGLYAALNGTYLQVEIKAGDLMAAEDAAAPSAVMVAGGRYDSSERTLDNGDAGAVALSVAGEMIAIPQAGYVMDGATRCQIKRKSGVAAGGAPGTDALISAVVGKKFRILALFLKATSATANNVYLGTTTDTDVLGDSGNPIPLAVDADGDNDSGFVMPWNPGGWTETSTANEALNLYSSAAQDIVYAITYIEVA